MKTFVFTVVIWKEQEGYVSKCHELGVASCGDTKSGATSNLREAIELYMENDRTLGILEDIEESLINKEKSTSHLEVTYA
ncbi:MAG: type II toxin-antitoxin system HicB family antitoxin [Nitrospirae bacterium]|nr:type II toxin-antitoxin system HicB family antitoxin [Nitrospirota bacterium]